MATKALPPEETTDAPPQRLPRYAFTVAQVERMVEVGVLNPDMKFELIGGEIAPMSPEHMPHMRMKAWLHHSVMSHLTEALTAAPDGAVYLSETSFLEPDLVVFKANAVGPRLTPADVVWAVEVAASSQHRDLVVKPPLYAGAGVDEYWVADLDARETVIHREPDGDVWRALRRVPFDQAVSPLCAPQMSLRLADAVV